MTNETKNTKTTKKKMFKTNLTVKIISMMMIMLLLTCFSVPTIANAVVVGTESVGEAVSKDITDDGWNYNINDDDTISITGYSGVDENAILPKTVDTLPVKHISFRCLKNTILKKLIIPDVENPYETPKIDQYFSEAFSYSTNLEEVEIGSMFSNTIPREMFKGSPKLKKVTFTEDFTKKAKELGGCYINQYAFSDCPSLKSFVFPEGITEIAGRAFENDMIENFVFEGAIKTVNLSSLLINTNSAKTVKNIVVLDKDSSIVGNNLENAIFYVPLDSMTELMSENDGYTCTDITTVDIDGFVNSIMNDENPSAPQPIIPPTSSTAETSETSEISDTTSSTGITGITEDTSNTGNTEEHSTTATLSPIFSATEGTSKPADKNELFCVCSYNNTAYIKKTISNFRISGNNITYSSNNSNIATVTKKNGVISTKKAGKATITANNKNNNTCVKLNLTVKNYPKPKLSKASLKLKKGHSYTLKISKRMTKATYSSSNKKIATVNKYGKIKANKKKKGTAIITVKANYYTLKCKVKVK